MLLRIYQLMSYVFQFIVTYWWLLILSFVSAVLELYIGPNIVDWFKDQRRPKYRRFSVMAAFLILTTIVKFANDVSDRDSTQAQKHQYKKNPHETTLSCGCINDCTCDSMTSCNETDTQTYVDSLILSSEYRELTIDELGNLNKEDLALLRNAIFAMAGAQYDYNSKYYAIFQSYDWYHPYVSLEEFKWDYFNYYQLENMNRITTYERSMGYRR